MNSSFHFKIPKKNHILLLFKSLFHHDFQLIPNCSKLSSSNSWTKADPEGLRPGHQDQRGGESEGRPTTGKKHQPMKRDNKDCLVLVGGRGIGKFRNSRDSFDSRELEIHLHMYCFKNYSDYFIESTFIGFNCHHKSLLIIILAALL